MEQYRALRTLLKRLTQAPGVSGKEGDAAKLTAELLAQYMPVTTDPLGNVVGQRAGHAPHILLDAHLDQIGMIVTRVDDSGFVKFRSVGGVDVRTLPAAEVTVWGKDPLFGVVTSTPPHLQDEKSAGTAPEMEQMAVDLGLSQEMAQTMVQPGDRITLRSRFASLLGSRIAATALDDRAGVAAILYCLELLKEQGYGGQLTVVFSAQEEVGGSGAAVSGFRAAAEEALAVDVSFAMAPGNPKERCAILGKGTMIGIAPTLDYAMGQTLLRLAQREQIACQHEVMGGKTGTNADALQRAGAGTKMGLLSIPLRNMHTGVEVVDLSDIASTAKLLARYIMERGGVA